MHEGIPGLYRNGPSYGERIAADREAKQNVFKKSAEIAAGEGDPAEVNKDKARVVEQDTRVPEDTRKLAGALLQQLDDLEMEAEQFLISKVANEQKVAMGDMNARAFAKVDGDLWKGKLQEIAGVDAQIADKIVPFYNPDGVILTLKI